MGDVSASPLVRACVWTSLVLVWVSCGRSCCCVVTRYMSDVQSAQPMLSPGHHCDLTRGDSTEKDGGPPDVLSKLATLALIVTVAISCTASAKCMHASVDQWHAAMLGAIAPPTKIMAAPNLTETQLLAPSGALSPPLIAARRQCGACVRFSICHDNDLSCRADAARAVAGGTAGPQARQRPPAELPLIYHHPIRPDARARGTADSVAPSVAGVLPPPHDPASSSAHNVSIRTHWTRPTATTPSCTRRTCAPTTSQRGPRHPARGSARPQTAARVTRTRSRSVGCCCRRGKKVRCLPVRISGPVFIESRGDRGLYRP